MQSATSARPTSAPAAHGCIAAAVGRANIGRCGAPLERIIRALVQSTDTIAVESTLLDLEIGAHQMLGRQVLDRKTDGLRGPGKPLIADWPVPLSAACWK